MGCFYNKAWYYVHTTHKEKLSEKQFFLIVNGPSCGGKSTVSDVIFDRYHGIFKGKYDVLKWLISDYTSLPYRTMVTEMTHETMRIALSYGMSVMKEGALYEPEKLINLAKEFNIPLFIVNVTAPKEILDERFQKRIAAKKNGAKIANVDPARFEELYAMYLETKMSTPLEFDSSKQSPEEIADSIVSYIRENNK